MLYLSALLTLLFAYLLRGTARSQLTSAAIALAFFASLLISATYLVSDRLTGDGINESVIYHMKMEKGGVGLDEFSNIVYVSIAALILIISLSIYSYKSTRLSHQSEKKWSRTAFAAGALITSTLINPGISDLRSLYTPSILGTKRTEYPSEYRIPKRLEKETSRKNIVYLYLESFERTYLDESLFPGLTPNLKALEKEALSFDNISQSYGSGWTIGGMVSSQCGIPLVTPSGGNSMGGVDLFLPEAICIGDILKSSNYELNYMGGSDLHFAGKGNFYKTHGFKKVDGIKALSHLLKDPKNRSEWGLYDDTLFSAAKNRFDELSKGRNPFGLFLLTLDTHHPRGHVSPSCKNSQYKDGSNPILNSVHCADQQAVDFVRHIQSQPSFKNTIIVVASDHLAMPNSAYDTLKKGERRNLFLILGDGIEARKISKPGVMLDVAPTLLNIFEENTSEFGFGRSLLKQDRTLRESVKGLDTYLAGHKSFLSSLWSFPNVKSGLRASAEDAKILLGSRTTNVPMALIVDENFDTQEIRYNSHGKGPLKKQIAALNYNQKFIWADDCKNIEVMIKSQNHGNSEFCIAFGTPGAQNVKVEVLSKQFSMEFDDIKRNLESIESKQDLATQRAGNMRYGVSKFASYSPAFGAQDLSGNIVIVSAGGNSNGKTFIENPAKEDPPPVLRGLTLFGITATSTPKIISHIDTCEAVNNRLTHNFQDEIERSINTFGAFIIVAHDSAVCGDIDLSELFARTGLNEWKKIQFRSPYIGIISGNGDRAEFLGNREEAIAVTAKDFVAATD